MTYNELKDQLARLDKDLLEMLDPMFNTIEWDTYDASILADKVAIGICLTELIKEVN